jgi:tRNA(Ile)-lysidine synthase TilS/MesJ
LILGNGFSINLTNGLTNFKNLYEKSNISKDANISKIFKELSEYDFEKVIDYLTNSSFISRIYGDSQNEARYDDDANRIREELIKTLEEIHPSDFNTISSYVADCGNFLKNFDSVFSLNYDLLLYWINVNQNIFKDGFGGANNSDTVDNIFHIRYFAKKETCDLHYLHGGLH